QPDGSGVAGSNVKSNTLPFTLTAPISVVMNNPGNQTDNEGDAVSVTITSPDPDASGFGATGLPPGMGIDPPSGVISGKIDPRGAGIDNVIVSASDKGTTGSTSFTWTVNDSNPPALTNPGN